MTKTKSYSVYLVWDPRIKNPLKKLEGLAVRQSDPVMIVPGLDAIHHSKEFLLIDGAESAPRKFLRVPPLQLMRRARSGKEVLFAQPFGEPPAGWALSRRSGLFPVGRN